MRDTEPWYRSELALKKRLNGPNTQPNARSIRRDSIILRRVVRLQQFRPAKSGRQVSELIAEITVRSRS